MRGTAAFWDRHADGYSRKPVANEAAYQAKLEKTREYFHPRTRAFEFGCGTGSTAIAHAPYLGEIIATDVSPRMIEIARKKAEAAAVDNVSFRVSSIEETARDEDAFDVVLGLSILHLVEDRDETLEKVFDLLEPGGVFVSSTVCLGDNMAWFRWVGPIGRALGVMPFVAVFTVAELRESLTRAGFEIDYEWLPDNRTAFIVAKKP